MNADVTPRKSAGGRPKGDPAAVRTATIGVRVSASEYAALREKAAQMHMTPAQWLREAALSRRLPSPPVAAINREQYAELARLAANLNQLARLANEGQRVVVADGLLERLAGETKRLRLALLGIGVAGDDR
jgi:Zn-dependent protease with chaperone function